jgi:sugar/nucleoside kinase (ribokinase family)
VQLREGAEAVAADAATAGAPLITTNTPIDYLVVGHVTKDVVPDGWVLGGTVSFCSITAQRLGRRAAVLTRCERLPELREYLESQGVGLHRVPADVTTTFENVYAGSRRTQKIGPVAPPIPADSVPDAWRTASVVHLGPVSQEVPPELADLFPSTSVIGVTPQGWLRAWDESGRVRPAPWHNAEQVLSRADVAIFSPEDVGWDQDLVKRYAEMAKLAVVTDAQEGCTVWLNGSQERYPAFDVDAVDPTGAGDVFATAFLLRYGDTQDAGDAARYANAAASYVVEARGISLLPTPEQVEERLRTGKLRD